MDKNEISFWDDDAKNVRGAEQFGLQANRYTSFEEFRDKVNL